MHGCSIGAVSVYSPPTTLHMRKLFALTLIVGQGMHCIGEACFQLSLYFLRLVEIGNYDCHPLSLSSALYISEFQWQRQGWAKGGMRPGRHSAGVAFGGAKIWNFEIWPFLGN